MENKYDEYLGKTSSMYYLAGIFGALLGGILLYLTSYEVIMYLSIIPKVINLVIAYKLKAVKHTSKIDNNIFKNVKYIVQYVKTNPILKRQIIVNSLSDGIGEALYQFGSKFYELVWPLWAIGIPAAMANAGMAMCNWFSGKILKKFGYKKIIIIGNIISIVTNVVGVSIQNIFSPFILCLNLLVPVDAAQSVIAQNLYVDEYRASLGSFKALISSLIYAVLALFVGAIADRFGIIITLVSFQAFKVIVILIYRKIFILMKEKEFKLVF